jgi:excisionase family DNA binding protein
VNQLPSAGILPGWQAPARKDVPRLLVNLDDAAAMLSISARSVQRLVESGQLKGVRLGGRRLFPVNELESFVARLVGDAAGDPVESLTQHDSAKQSI